MLDDTSRDDHIHHLVGAFEDLVDPQVTQVALNGIILQVSIATVELESLVGNLYRQMCKGKGG